MGDYKTVLDPDILLEFDHLEPVPVLDDSALSLHLPDLPELPEQETLNIIILSLIFILGLATNFIAFPVILFRRTKFGNGQFAVLVLCLTVTDILTVFSSILGGLILEGGAMTWVGTTTGCSAYYFITSWLLGLVNYIVTVSLGMIHVKRSPGWIARLQELRMLLLFIVIATLLPALTELLIRSTIYLEDDISICIITAEPVAYGFYVCFKLLMSHILPVIIVFLTLIRPQTRAAKRFSTLFLGEGSACECGPSGEEYKVPHECPSIGTRPDLVTSHTQIQPPVRKPTVVTMTAGKTRTMAIQEDPHRKKYKCLLSCSFLFCTCAYVLINISHQVLSGLDSSDQIQATKYLTSGLYLATYIKQIIHPLIFLYVEFYHN